MKSQIVIHIGLPKTGTTSLQHFFFPCHSQIDYLGKHYVKARKDYDQRDQFVDSIIRLIYSRDEIEFDLTFCKNRFDKVKEGLNGKRVAVISYEALTENISYIPADRKLIAQRLYNVFGESKIIITIRNQLDMIVSAWAETAAKLARYKPFKIWLIEQNNNFYRGILYRLKYFELIEAYSRIFGKDNIGVFLLEDLKEDPRKYYIELSNYLNIDTDESLFLLEKKTYANPRFSRRKITYAKWCRRLGWDPLSRFEKYIPDVVLAGFRKQIEGGPPIEVEFSKENEELLSSYYRESNRNLLHNYSVDLSGKGYPL